MKLFDLDEADVRAAFDDGAPAYLLVNPVEYHGPHLSLLNDHVVARGLARDLHARLNARRDPAARWPFLLTHDLNVGVEPAPGPGSIPVSHRDVVTKVVKACRELSRLGAQKVAIMTFHGSPNHAAALEIGVKYLRRKGVRAISPLNAALRGLLDLRPSTIEGVFAHIDDLEERAVMMASIEDDFHGGFIESSLAMHYAPETVKPIIRDLPACPPLVPSTAISLASRAAARACGKGKAVSRELLMIGKSLAWMKLRPFPGYTGHPRWARPEVGAIFAEGIIDEYAAIAESVFAGSGRSPAPFLNWISVVSLRGRIAPPDIPLNAMLQI